MGTLYPKGSHSGWIRISRAGHSDGDWDASDDAAITGPYDVRKDAGLDGAVTADDVTRANAITGGYQTVSGR